MEIIKDSEIQKAIDNGKCPTHCFCDVATTVYSAHEREHKCLECWIDYCKKIKNNRLFALKLLTNKFYCDIIKMLKGQEIVWLSLAVPQCDGFDSLEKTFSKFS